MKRLLFSFGAAVLLLTGAGCLSSFTSGTADSADPTGKWKLDFDLPSGWVEVVNYPQPLKTAVTLSKDVNHTMGVITLQNTDKAIARTTTPEASVPTDSYVTANYTKIDVDWLDSRRAIPKDATDLGNGFYKAAASTEPCDPGSCTTSYYFKTDAGEKYLFTVWQNGQDISVAEPVILSAKVVTEFTDTAPSAAVGDVKTNE